jgi:predicted component of type VI protein secretion system
MNYVLQVVRGRSATTTLRLADGVTSVGRHDDCIIRIKSSQVSRRHCEFHDVDGRLTVRDLGSSNGTFVNGKRVLGQQVLKVGDELTVGTVTLRVATLGQPVAASHPQSSKPGDTAVVEALPVDDDDEEFEIEFDEGGPTAVADIEAIPLADADEAPAAPSPQKAATPAAAAEKAPAKPAGNKVEDEAVAQFLLDLNLDEE